MFRAKGGGGSPRKSKKRRGGKKKRRGGPPQRMGPPRRRPKGHCVCPACGAKVAVYTDVPCYIMHCSKCGTKLVKDSGSKPPKDIQLR
jgi:ribosomal protein S27E